MARAKMGRGESQPTGCTRSNGSKSKEDGRWAEYSPRLLQLHPGAHAGGGIRRIARREQTPPDRPLPPCPTEQNWGNVTGAE